MRDLVFLAYLAMLIGMGFKRPFLFVLAYSYIDIVSPQRLSYYLLNSIPVSLIAFLLALGGWLAIDDKKDTRFSFRQGLLCLLLVYCFFTTRFADFPMEAAGKWDWVWKALVFAIFLPLTLRTKLRIEALSLIMVLCASSILITGGIKTLLSGGGYGSLTLLVDNNNGLYEGSIISTVAICIIPLILYLSKHGTVFTPDWRVKAFAYALCLACLLIPIGTQARTGLVCAAVLCVLMLLRAKRRLLYGTLVSFAVFAAIPFLPDSYTQRMSTISDHQADQSASTRVAVWKWTWEYAKANPLGGGFEAYRQNEIAYSTLQNVDDGTGHIVVKEMEVVDRGRAYHNSYFELLGEQGFPGLFIWLGMNLICIYRTERLRRRYAWREEPEVQWISPLALALQQGHIVYLLGSMFVAIAFQPFMYMLVALQIGLDVYIRRREKDQEWRPFGSPRAISPA